MVKYVREKELSGGVVMRYQLFTRNGYDFYEIASLLQKAIRRGDYKKAGFAAFQLIEKYRKYLWKRLLIISAEDCYGIITKEIVGLKCADDEAGGKEYIFVAKAICLLCEAKKNRDACYVACNYMNEYNNLEPEEIHEPEPIEKCQLGVDGIPDYVFDVHTLMGKKMGKTVENMIHDEQAALYPKQVGMFDNASWEDFLKTGRT